MTKQVLPHTLSMRRCVQLSDGQFFSVMEEGSYRPLYGRRDTRVGTQNFMSAEEPRNILDIDTASLDPFSDKLAIRFGLHFNDLRNNLENCHGDGDLSVFKSDLSAFTQSTLRSQGLVEVARRYAHNILSANWTWRNLEITRQGKVIITLDGQPFIEEDIAPYQCIDFSADTRALDKLTGLIIQQCRGENRQVMTVTAELYTGMKGSRVHPSQLYLHRKEKGLAQPMYTIGHPPIHQAEKGVRILGMAALRDVKIGNRLRTIDTWYPDYPLVGRPIPVEPIGANLSDVCFYRSRTDNAFTLLPKLGELDPESDSGMFMIATLFFRGGVYTKKAE